MLAHMKYGCKIRTDTPPGVSANLSASIRTPGDGCPYIV